jgi:DNA-directed RNA polymerase specialized sigma24 family protein
VSRALPVPAIAAGSPGRRRIADALARSTTRERLVLALLLVERLTPEEVARALDCRVSEVERIYRLALAGLKAALRRRATGRPSRAIARAASRIESRSRRAA